MNKKPAAKYFSVEEKLSDGSALRSVFMIEPAKLSVLAGRIRKKVPQLNKTTAEQCAVVYARMMTEEVNKMAANLIEQATAVAMARIASDLKTIADGIASNVTPAAIRRAVKEKTKRTKHNTPR